MTVFYQLELFIKTENQKKIFQTITFIIFWDFLMFYQIFLSPQVKRSAVITYKNGLFELPRQLLNDLRFKRLGELETNPFTLLGRCRILSFSLVSSLVLWSKYSNPFSRSIVGTFAEFLLKREFFWNRNIFK